MALRGSALSPERPRAVTVRPAALAGRTYAASAPLLRAELARYFEHPDGAGPPRPSDRPAPAVRGVLSPHIDFFRGGPAYTWAYRPLAERCDADVFVVLGVAHQACRHRFALTRRHFDTPLGTVTTDNAFVESLASRAGSHLFDDERAHDGEHSVEFQAVFLQYLFGGRRPFTIVPVLVGSFYDLMMRRTEPIRDPEVARFVGALRETEAECGKKVAYVGGIDLSHIGQEFGDPFLLDAPTLERLDAFDRSMLDRAVANDPQGWFDTAGRVDNRWRVCGLAATYTMLHAMGPARGRLTRYARAVDDRLRCCVSFASVVYEVDRG